MSLHPQIHYTAADGSPATIWNLGVKVPDLKAAEPIVKRSMAQALRAGGSDLRIDVYDDLACRSVWSARVKS